MSAFRLSEERMGPVVLLRASGKMTLGDGPEMMHETIHKLVEEGRPRIVLDLEGVSYIDSAGLGGIVSAFSTVRTSGGTLVLAAVPKRVHDLLQLTKLLTVFETFESTEKAVAHLTATAPK